jgi:transposase InsO family protein
MAARSSGSARVAADRDGDMNPDQVKLTADHGSALAQIKHLRTKPYTPKTNGKAERFVQTSLGEWA